MFLVRHAFWCNVLMLSAKRPSKIFIFEVLRKTRTRSCKSLIFYFYVKSIRAKQAKVHLQRDQREIIEKQLT